MTELILKKITSPDGGEWLYYNDVKRAVLELSDEIIKYSEERDGLITIGKGEVHRLMFEIFGDFEE